ncbi:hypothetical protein [Ruminococcus flavefaciens]|uniref:hypothetical protein n=1 Tax=Ruminococcus flavefaciens TaxID=1265 RepID=UPI0026F2CCF3|nr:hypothetical protein [Ruminococcus flavefaciens]
MGSTSFESITAYFPEKLRKLILGIPATLLEDLTEIRLRTAGPVYLVYSDRILYLCISGRLSSVYNESAYIVGASVIRDIVDRLCHFSVHSCTKQLSEGFFVIENGVRVGLSGAYSSSINPILTEFTSLNFRLSRSVDGCAEEIFSSYYDNNIMICGGVNSGKTTILRDICRLCGNLRKTALIDERNEISCLCKGVPQRSIGVMTDVISNISRSEGIVSAIRTLSPEVIVCDEIASVDDSEAIISGIGCGVKFIVTAHGNCFTELMKRKEIIKLKESGLMDIIIFLKGASAPGKIREVVRL